MPKTKALISCAVTAQLICIFVLAYAKSRISQSIAVCKQARYRSAYLSVRFYAVENGLKKFSQPKMNGKITFSIFRMENNFFLFWYLMPSLRKMSVVFELSILHRY